MPALFLTLIGPPGAGKGTQSAALCSAFGLNYLSTGDMMREAAKAAGPEGDQLREYASSGHLAPDGFTNEMVFRRLSTMTAGCLLDGYPRTVAQAVALDDFLGARGDRLDLAILLDMDERKLADRLIGRLVCPGCGTSYHRTMMAPRAAGTCDHDGLQLSTRPDDVPQRIAIRLQAYREQTAALIGHYQQTGRLARVSADAHPADVGYQMRTRVQQRLAGR